MIGLRLVTQIRNSDHGLASGSGITKIQRKEESEFQHISAYFFNSEGTMTKLTVARKEANSR